MIVWIACAALICLYAVASVIAFGALGGFLTYALVHQIGNVRMLSSSVTAYLTTPVVLTLVGVPLRLHRAGDRDRQEGARHVLAVGCGRR